MSEAQTLQSDPTPEAQARFHELAADEDYWDYLDYLDHRSHGAREWDNAVDCGGAA